MGHIDANNHGITLGEEPQFLRRKKLIDPPTFQIELERNVGVVVRPFVELTFYGTNCMDTWREGSVEFDDQRTKEDLPALTSAQYLTRA